MADETRETRRAATQARNLISFTDDNAEDTDAEEQQMPPPKHPAPKKSARQGNKELEYRLEHERLEFEKQRMQNEHEIRMKELELELARVNKSKKDNVLNNALPFKIKLQPFNHKSKEDILTFISEFESISAQAKWTDDIKILQLRTLLTGEARDVAQQTNQSYEELKRALLDRFGAKQYEYLGKLLNMRKDGNETYRGLWAKIDQSVNRFVDSRNAVECFKEEFFLRAVPTEQAQWIRRNRGSGTVVDAAEDYVPNRLPPRVASSQENNPQSSHSNRNKMNQVQCHVCKKTGHYARDCRNKQKGHNANLASYLVKPLIGTRLISVPGEVDGREIMFVKDSGADVTLIREDLVDCRNIIEGQNMTLYTAIGQPFSAKMAIVKIDSPFFKGHKRVGVVPNLAAEGLLGMDVLEPLHINVVTRAQARNEDGPSADEDPKIDACNDDINTCVNAENLAKLQLSDESLSSVRDKALPSREAAEELKEAFYWDNRILRRKWTNHESKSGNQIVLPTEYRQNVIKLGHAHPFAGHLGISKSKDRISASFYWPGMFKDIQSYCLSCDTCQRTARKRETEKHTMITPPVVDEPFRKISMDIVGPLERTKLGYKYILTVVDEATRYPEAFPLKNIEAKSIADALIQLFSRVGIPQTILTDQGSNFKSQLLREMYALLGARGCTTSPYRPQSNGRCERFNGTLKSMLKKLCTENQEDWDQLLPYALFAYREVKHEETGFAPFDLLYGWPVRGPLQVLRDIMTGDEDAPKSVIEHIVNMRERLSSVTAVVKETLAIKKPKVKQWFDKRACDRKLSPGDQVLILLPSDSSKMKAQWKGPFRVVRKVNDVNYQINVGGRRGLVTYHINLLRKYNQAVFLVADTPDVDGTDVENDIDFESNENASDVVLSPDLTKTQRDQLRSLCEEFEDVLTGKPGCTSLIEHTIRTTTDSPVTCKPYRIPYHLRDEVKDAVDNMVKEGIASPSTSPYSAPIVPIRKRDGNLRICIDYRRLNAVTLSDNYYTPRIDEVFEKVGKAKFISRMDLTKGYFQVPLAEDCREKSAFVTPFGTFQMNVMPFGMKTSPSTFSRLMDKTLAGLPNVVSYFDDIVIYSGNDFDEHLTHIRAVLNRLREVNITARPTKCELGCSEIRILGHVIGNGELKTDTAKVKAMVDYPLPTTKKGIRSYLGLCGYYRKFIKNYAELSMELTKLTRKKESETVKWTDKAIDSFKKLKEALTTAPVLITPDFTRQFIVQTDASDFALGAVLSQRTDNGDEHPIAYLSRRLLPREQNYSTVEKECLAIVWAVESFKYYLTGAKFRIETDHDPLVWLYKVKDKNQRLLRWALALQPYDFEIFYRKGSQNGNSDFLSRV